MNASVTGTIVLVRPCCPQTPAPVFTVGRYWDTRQLQDPDLVHIRSLQARNSQVAATSQPRIFDRESGGVLAARGGHAWHLAENHPDPQPADAIVAEHAEAPRDSDRRDDPLPAKRPINVNHAGISSVDDSGVLRQDISRGIAPTSGLRGYVLRAALSLTCSTAQRIIGVARWIDRLTRCPGPYR